MLQVRRNTLIVGLKVAENGITPLLEGFRTTILQASGKQVVIGLKAGLRRPSVGLETTGTTHTNFRCVTIFIVNPPIGGTIFSATPIV